MLNYQLIYSNMESESMNLNTIRTDSEYNFVKLFNEALAENDDIENSTSGIISTDVADHFGTFHIVNKCKQPPVQKYSQIRQMKTDNVLRFNNILANADYSSVLLSDCPNYAYHTFMEIYTNAFNEACPVKSIKTPKRYIKREPRVTNGILTSSLTKSKLLIKKLKKPTEQNINAFKKYCIIFDKVKKLAKESYFNLELELNKNNLKKTWEILRQLSYT